MMATVKHLDECGQGIAFRSGIQIEFLPRTPIESVPCSALVREAIVRSCAELGFKSQSLPSGAGHDAQMMAKLAPIGMIFVPSMGGISHSPREFTSSEDCARGAQLLLESILRLDERTQHADRCAHFSHDFVGRDRFDLLGVYGDGAAGAFHLRAEMHQDLQHVMRVAQVRNAVQDAGLPREQRRG